MNDGISNVRLTQKGLFDLFLRLRMEPHDRFGRGSGCPHTPLDQLDGSTADSYGFGAELAFGVKERVADSDTPQDDLECLCRDAEAYAHELSAMAEDFLAVTERCAIEPSDVAPSDPGERAAWEQAWEEYAQTPLYSLERFLALPNVPDEVRAIFSPSRPLSSLQKFRLFHAAPSLNREAA